MSLESSLQRMNELNTMVSGSSTAAATAQQVSPQPGFSDQLAQANSAAQGNENGLGTQAQEAGLRARIAAASSTLGASIDGTDDPGTIEIYGGAGASQSAGIGGANASPYGAAPYTAGQYAGG